MQPVGGMDLLGHNFKTYELRIAPRQFVFRTLLILKNNVMDKRMCFWFMCKSLCDSDLDTTLYYWSLP